MAQSSRRQSQNSALMRQIIEQLREYDLEEVKYLCRKFTDKEKRISGRKRRKK